MVGVNVKLFKEPTNVAVASGDEVQFKICWSNYSSGTAENFLITDRVPNGFSYVDNVYDSDDHFCGATHGFSDDSTVTYSTEDSDLPITFTEMSFEVAGVQWLKWSIPSAVSANTTGCVCFKAKVD